MLSSWVSAPPACKYRVRATIVATSVRDWKIWDVKHTSETLAKLGTEEQPRKCIFKDMTKGVLLASCLSQQMVSKSDKHRYLCGVCQKVKPFLFCHVWWVGNIEVLCIVVHALIEPEYRTQNVYLEIGGDLQCVFSKSHQTPVGERRAVILNDQTGDRLSSQEPLKGRRRERLREPRLLHRHSRFTCSQLHIVDQLCHLK